ncbi:Uncharacterised protein [Vibrio cholerae]|nr:Uncharacterised protein [Vibrio cholerae]CSI80414.1 Uncharacterised protein [Vibrio cholerae]
MHNNRQWNVYLQDTKLTAQKTMRPVCRSLTA